MKAFFLAWNKKREPLVWNGIDWRPGRTEPEQRRHAKLIEEGVARESLNAMLCRFPGLGEIVVCPVAAPVDVAERHERRKRR
jgi:hypothetical protein